MDIIKGRNKNSRKCSKKSTKLLNRIQPVSRPKNYHVETAKIGHQCIQIANLPTEKYPTMLQMTPESSKYYIIKRRLAVKKRKLNKNGRSMSNVQDKERLIRRLAVKQRKLNKNGESTSNLQEPTSGCQETHLDRFFTVRQNLEVDTLHRRVNKKCPTEKIEKCYDPYHHIVDVQHEKLFHAKSLKSKVPTDLSKNFCLVDNKLNCEDSTLLFQCSDASLQLEQSKTIDTKKINFNGNFTSKEAVDNMIIQTKKTNFSGNFTSKQDRDNMIIDAKKTNLNENLNSKHSRENMVKKGYNYLNDILPKFMQHITLYRMMGNLSKKFSSETDTDDNIYSSMSTCSSSSSTREYYLPAISNSSTDTMHVANLLAKQRLMAFSKGPDQIILNEQKIIQRDIKNVKNAYNKNVSNVAPVYQQSPLVNEISGNSIEMKEAGLDKLKMGNRQIIFSHPLFPYDNFNSFVFENKSRVVNSDEKSSIGVQTEEGVARGNDQKHSIIGKNMETERVKSIKQNYAVSNKSRSNKLLSITMDKNEEKYLNFLTSVSTHNYKKLMNNVIEEVTKMQLDNQTYKTCLHTNGKETITLNCIASNSNVSNVSVSKQKNKSVSEHVLITVNGERNQTNQIQTSIKKPISSLCISNEKSESSDSPSYKSCIGISNDTLNKSKRFVKLNPFFDEGLKDPKISRLILTSKILAGEGEGTIDKGEICPDGIVFRNNAKKMDENLNKEMSVKEVMPPDVAKISSTNEKNKPEAEKSQETIFSTDSIIYGSNAFQKIRERFDLIHNKNQIDKENKQFQGKDSLNKLGESKPKHLKNESFHCPNKAKDKSQSINHNNMNINNDSSFRTKVYRSKSFTPSNNFLMNDIKSEGMSDKKKYLLLLTKGLNVSNIKLDQSVKELSKKNKNEKIIGLSNNHDKSDMNIMDDKQKLININLKSCSSNGLKLSPAKNEIMKSGIEKTVMKYLSEKETQVNMYFVETSEKQVGDTVLNKISVVDNEKVSTTKIGKTSEIATMNGNSHTKATMINDIGLKEGRIVKKSDQPKSTILNDNGLVEAKLLNNNRSTEEAILNVNGLPIILYNSSGYPITDLNGRVLKNNLGAYLLSTDKYADVITKQLPVYDCNLKPVSSTSFDPTKKPYVKIQHKITDRCGNPVSLFNNLGWPLTNENGFFLHDNYGKLLVAMDSFNFPLCCSNGSPIYLQNGAMLLSQKFKYIVTKPGDINFTEKPLNIRRKYDIEVNCNYNKDSKINILTPAVCSKKASKLKHFKSSHFYKHKEKQPNLNYDLLFPTEVPELMHELFHRKTRPRFRSQGGIPQSPIPIFDRLGNRLTDENGFPIKNKYGEYMLLLDKNGFALSDSCGGPIFDSSGKQLWLKDLYHMKQHPSFNYFYDRYTPPEHPYTDTSTSDNQNTTESSDDVVPLLDLNFEDDQTSEPVMNYIKQNKIETYDMDNEQVRYIHGKSCRANRKPKWSNFLKNFSIPISEKQYQEPPLTNIKENVLLYGTGNYEGEAEYDNLYRPFSQIQNCNFPYRYDQSVYENSKFTEQDPLIDSLEQYNNNDYYHDLVPSEHYEFNQDAEFQYYNSYNNNVMYY